MADRSSDLFEKHSTKDCSWGVPNGFSFGMPLQPYI